jgi:CheY-like chemotaxis protein
LEIDANDAKKFAISKTPSQTPRMTRPLALFVYERLMPGGQLVNRLQDLGYRVQSLDQAATLVEQAEREKPLLVMADLEPRQQEVCAAIAALKANRATTHIPVIAFAAVSHPAVQEAGRAAGATLVVNDTAILLHLEQFLDQALQVD